MIFEVTAALCTVAAFIITGRRVVSFKTMARHATIIDVGFTVAMLALFAGTLTGMLVAILAGLLMAITLTGIRLICGLSMPRITWPAFSWPFKQHPDWAAGNF